MTPQIEIANAAAKPGPTGPRTAAGKSPRVRESVFSDNLVALESHRRKVIQEARGLCMRGQFARQPHREAA